MNKGILALPIVVALVVAITPGVIGHVAEQSVNDSLEWADSQNGTFVISGSEFERGWFSSSGQHRIELLRGELYDELVATFGVASDSRLPTLIVGTHLDHGIIPLSSLRRSNGSLVPALGSAVSTLALEFGDGSIESLPTTIYTNIGLTGALRSQLSIEASGINTANERVDWGGSEFLISSSPAGQSFGVVGAFTSLAIKSENETTIVGHSDIDLQLTATPYGYMVGLIRVALESIVVVGAQSTITIGPMSIDADSSLDDDRINGELALSVENSPMPMGGSGSVELIARLDNADAAAFGDALRSVQAMQSAIVYEEALAQLEGDLLQLLAAGMELHFDQLDILSPFGQLTSRANAAIGQSDDIDYTWATATSLLDASLDVSLPKALVDMATQSNPELHGLIGMGYLRKRDEFYIMEASFDGSLLIINGAPTPIPLSGL